MDSWKIKLVNSETITVKAKKKELTNESKALLSAKKIDNNTETEILVNRNNVLWFERLDSSELENE